MKLTSEVPRYVTLSSVFITGSGENVPRAHRFITGSGENVSRAHSLVHYMFWGECAQGP